MQPLLGGRAWHCVLAADPLLAERAEILVILGLERQDLQRLFVEFEFVVCRGADQSRQRLVQFLAIVVGRSPVAVVQHRLQLDVPLMLLRIGDDAGYISAVAGLGSNFFHDATPAPHASPVPRTNAAAISAPLPETRIGPEKLQ